MPQNSRRTTSTGKHPEWRQDRKSVPNKAARIATGSTKLKAWYITLSSVSTCLEAELKDGQGLKPVWASDVEGQNQAKKYCVMRLKGDPKNLQIAIGLYPGNDKAFSKLLFEEEIRPGGYASIGVKSFELTQRLQITCRKTGAVPKDTVWDVSFLLDSAERVGMCKISLRRLMRTVSKMPDDCIFYRNFADPQVGEEGRLTLERDNGFTVTYGGFLVTAEGRRLVGESLPDDPPAIVTRSGGASQKKARGKKQAKASDEDDSEPIRPLTRRQKRANKKARKEQRKQKRREHVSSPSADDEEAEKASKSRATESESELSQDQAAEQAGRNKDGSSSPEAEQWDSDEDFEIESLSGVRRVKNKTYYRVNWSDHAGKSWPPSWEPEDNISLESIEAYYKAKASSAATQPRRGSVIRGGRRQAGRGHVVPSRGVKVVHRRGQGS
ncbi:MAG: hypothetical protein OHK93_002042 [Ramalina farinacea]|uniref:Chromo domain-containing protein n=1 Tax=Ramalina farinacea TaxID=258253 RepID=A0AA43QRI0_9LECA|nr:hypothetical protein [Ramalina farinacea]